MESALKSVGEFGQYQKVVVLVFFFINIVVGNQLLITYFVAIDPSWKCVRNSTDCGNVKTILPNTDSSRCSINRSDWSYTKSRHFSTVTQFDLSCSREWIVFLTNSMLFIGWGGAAIFLGSIADNFERKIVLFQSLAIMIIATFISAFSPNVYFYMLARLLVGATFPGIIVQTVVLGSELVGAKQRALTTQMILAAQAIGASMSGGIAYFVRDWKSLLLWTSLPYTPLLATYAFIPESFRWLVVKQKMNKVEESLKIIASWNGREQPDELRIVDSGEDTMVSSVTVLNLFRRRYLVRNVVQGFGWLGISVVYYGLYFAADDLEGSVYRDFIILSIVDLPGCFATFISMDYFGPKKTIIASTMISGAACISIGFLMDGHRGNLKLAKIIIGMIGKFFGLISFNGYYTWSSELYPTSIRSLAMGFFQVIARIGSASAPWIGKGLRHVSFGTPYFVLGALATVSGLSCSLLPETRRKTEKEKVSDPGNNSDCEMVGLAITEEVLSISK